jgi:hypothetical protein
MVVNYFLKEAECRDLRAEVAYLQSTNAGDVSIQSDPSLSGVSWGISALRAQAQAQRSPATIDKVS